MIGLFDYNHTCNPFITNASNFQIKLNGQYYPQNLPLYENKTFNFTCLNSSPQIKTILLWNKFRGDPIFEYNEGVREPFLLHNCPVTNCELTTNRSKANQSDFILFHIRSRISDYPPFRFDLQRWVIVLNKYNFIFLDFSIVSSLRMFSLF